MILMFKMRRKVVIKTLPKVVWFENQKMWEVGYIKSILPDYKHIFLNRNMSLLKDIKSVKVFIINEDGHQDKYSEYKQIIEEYKPKLLIHLSDEYFKCQDIVEKLYPLCPDVWRQYPFKFYDFPGENVRVIPLGYKTGICEEIDRPIMIQERKYFWSFIGNYKNKHNQKERDDRVKMIELFKKNNSNNFLDDATEDPYKIREIYSDTIFVPIGLNLLSGKSDTTIKEEVYVDCLRTYEALVCGAIPVTINCKNTFDYPINPPIITADTYEELFETLNSMSDEEINNKRNQLIIWWCDVIKELRGTIV